MRIVIVTLFVSCVCPAFAFGQTQHRGINSQFLPKTPVSASPELGDTKALPMSLEERIKQKIVPKLGIVSTGTDGGTLLSGDGKMMVELAGNPLEDDIIFHHERIMQPWKRPFEALSWRNILHCSSLLTREYQSI